MSMPIISDKKKQKISEQILYYLFSCSPDSKFTSDIAQEVARDEEFIKSLMLELQKKGLVVLVSKNSAGIVYQKRQRWRLSNQAYTIYSSRQPSLHKSHSSTSNEELDF